MYCRYCREKVDENDRICKKCGKDLSVKKEKEYKYCKYCFTNNQTDAKFCYKCSADLPDKVIKKNKLLSIIIGILLSFIISFVAYKLTNIQISFIDVILFVVFALVLWDWLDGVFHQKIEEKNNKHLSVKGLIRTIRYTLDPTVEIGGVLYDYEEDVKSTDDAVEKKLYSSTIFYHLRFVGKLALILLLFILVHFSPFSNDEFLVFLLFTFIITNCML